MDEPSDELADEQGNREKRSEFTSLIDVGDAQGSVGRDESEIEGQRGGTRGHDCRNGTADGGRSDNHHDERKRDGRRGDLVPDR